MTEDTGTPPGEGKPQTDCAGSVSDNVNRIDAPTLLIRGLTKRFGRNEVLRGIDLEVKPGDFVGLMGPNGAGKSTLIKVLDGLYPKTSGEVLLGGRPVSSLGGLRDVGFIHQDLGLVDELSIADNLGLGHRSIRRGPFVNRGGENNRASDALARVQLNRSPATLVRDLAPGERALVAIARAFDQGAKILFVDESTSALPPADVDRVVVALKRTAELGASIVMVTHKLAEILDATRRVVVILDGVIAADEITSQLDRSGLVLLLHQHETGRTGNGVPAQNRQPFGAGEVLLALDGAVGGRAGPVDLEIRAGEVVGLTGSPGSGLHDLGLMAAGALKPVSGTATTAPGVRRALVPPYRETQGGFNDLDVAANLTISALRRWMSWCGLLRKSEELKQSRESVRDLNVQPAETAIDFGVLSGGNKQKVILGRALLREPNLLVLCEPTRGVDVGTRSELYSTIREFSRRREVAVLVVSSDAEDLFGLCDRVAVINDGILGEIHDVDDLTAADMEQMV